MVGSVFGLSLKYAIVQAKKTADMLISKKQTKNRISGLVLALFCALTVLSVPAVAFADDCSNTTSKTVDSKGKTVTQVDESKVQKCLNDSPIVGDIQQIVDFLSVGIGVIVTGVIILGGIQYSMAGDNPQAVGAAKQRMMNGLIALVAFFFIFAFLQWLIPGGIFK